MNTEQAIRSVDLLNQIELKLESGFPLAVEERIEAEELGINVAALELEFGYEPEIADEAAIRDYSLQLSNGQTVTLGDLL